MGRSLPTAGAVSVTKPPLLHVSRRRMAGALAATLAAWVPTLALGGLLTVTTSFTLCSDGESSAQCAAQHSRADHQAIVAGAVAGVFFLGVTLAVIVAVLSRVPDWRGVWAVALGLGVGLGLAAAVAVGAALSATAGWGLLASALVWPGAWVFAGRWFLNRRLARRGH